MRFAFMVDPQEGLSYARMRDLAQEAEGAGFEAFFRSDHWLSVFGDWTAVANDAWTTLAALARDTTTIRLGTLVSPVTFRQPIALAKAVTTVDEISEGRVELGIGAGWYDLEHLRFGVPYPPVAERFEMLQEQLAILTGLWTEATFNFSGRHYQLHEATCEPKPVQRPHPPIIVGGSGKPKLVRLAAIYADELNLDGNTPEESREVFERLDAACEAVNRDPQSVCRSVMLHWSGAAAQTSPSDQRRLFSAYALSGVDRIILDAWPGPITPRGIEVFGREVLADFR
jgi:F420-dependent oxidoreductase-like protein